MKLISIGAALSLVLAAGLGGCAAGDGMHDMERMHERGMMGGAMGPAEPAATNCPGAESPREGMMDHIQGGQMGAMSGQQMQGMQQDQAGETQAQAPSVECPQEQHLEHHPEAAPLDTPGGG